MDSPSQPMEPQQSKSWVKIGVIVIIILIVAIVAVYFYKNNKTEGPAATTQPEIVEQLPPITSYVGTITAKDTETITVSAPAEKNVMGSDATLRIIVGEQTTIREISIPEQIVPGQTNIQFSTKNISFSDLTLGDEVTITTDGDTRGEEIFAALGIDVRAIN